MRLQLTFATPGDQEKFLAAVGETSASDLPIGLINMAFKNPAVTSLTTTGEPALFHIKNSSGTWYDGLVSDPVSELKAGVVLEPAEIPIKLLSEFSGVPTTNVITSDMTWAQNRIANRYHPLVANPVLAELTEQRAVEVIVVDSGIYREHSEFSSASIEDLYVVPSMGADTTDADGHGTAVTSLIVGAKLGVNPLAKIKVVKIFSDTAAPTLRELGLALDAIYDYHLTCVDVPKIVNCSWVSVASDYAAVKFKKLMDAGIVVVAAAGNTAVNIDDVSPAGIPGVITVAASNPDDTAYVDVYGVNKKLDLFAPGKNVGAASTAGPDQFITISGSSLAAPLTSGVVSILAGLFSQTPSVTEVKDALIKDATPAALLVSSAVSINENRLLHRPDATALSDNQVFYAGSIGVGSGLALTVELNTILPIGTFQSNVGPLTFDVEWESPEAAAAGAGTTVNSAGTITIQLAENFTLGLEEKLKQLSFKVSCLSPGINFTSPDIHFFATSSTVTQQDISAILDKLDSQSYLVLHSAVHGNLK